MRKILDEKKKRGGKFFVRKGSRRAEAKGKKGGNTGGEKTRMLKFLKHFLLRRGVKIFYSSYTYFFVKYNEVLCE